MGKSPRVFPAVRAHPDLCLPKLLRRGPPSRRTLRTVRGRSGNRWPDVVVTVSKLRHSTMLRPRTRYAANSVTHAELEDHRDWRHVRSGLFSTESAGFAAWPTSASPRNKLAANYLAFI